MRNIAEKLGVTDHILFTGPLADASQYMVDFDVIVVPTIPYGNNLGEGFGLVTVESMAASVPTVVTLCGGLPEIVEDGISGVVIPVKSSNAVAEAVVKLLEDKSNRERIGAAGRCRIERYFTITHTVDKLVSLYSRVKKES